MIAPVSEFRRKILAWYRRHRRDLPWRVPLGAKNRPEPYAVLVSEAMLQQTQVLTVVSFYNAFIRRFPTIHDLAAADEHAVLRAWQGLGYYTRARNLHRAAQAIVRDYHGQIPRSVEDLLALPGVGRYTAGAIASLAYDVAAPILDGNVARVLCRIDAIRDDPISSRVRQQLWRRAEQLVPKRSAGDFNSALMELGATVCTPRSPCCRTCPVRDHCRANAEGLTDVIPPPRRRKPTPLHRRVVLCLLRRSRSDHLAHVLIERRPQTGRWAGLWQFPTRPVNEPRHPDWGTWRTEFGQFPKPAPLTVLNHQLSHRRYEFHAFAVETVASGLPESPTRTWVSLERLDEYPLSRPQALIAERLLSGRPLAPRGHRSGSTAQLPATLAVPTGES